MSMYDIVMLVVFGGAVLFGFWKGLAWQIASLAAIIVSYLVAINFREPVAQIIHAEPPWDKIGAMLILFVATSLVIWTIYSRVSKTIKNMKLKGFDRQAGALLGAVKGALLCMVITVLSVSWMGDGAHDTIHHSKLGPYIVSGIGAVSAVVPKEIAQIIDPHVDEFKKELGHPIDQPVEDYPQGGSRYSIGTGLFGNGQDDESGKETEGRAPAFRRGQLHWGTSNTPTNTTQPTSFFGNSLQSAFHPASDESSDEWSQIKSYSQGLVDSASDEVIKRASESWNFGKPR